MKEADRQRTELKVDVLENILSDRFGHIGLTFSALGFPVFRS